MSINIVLLGSTGVGKSSFGNYILKSDNFIESNKTESCTDEIKCCKGKENTEVENLYIIDTPGISDSKGRDEYFAKLISKELKYKYTNDINSFLLLFNINNSRLSLELKKLLYYYCLMFPIKDFWNHVGIVFTFSYEYIPDKQFKLLKESKTKDFIDNIIKTLKTHIEDINSLYFYNINIPEKFNIFFTDCGEVTPQFNHQRTDQEIKNIIEWASSLPKLDLSKANTNIKINYKYYKQIKDSVNIKKIFINSEKYKLIKQYTKQYKSIDFDNKEKYILEQKYYKENISIFKLYKYKDLESSEKKIYNDDYFSLNKKFINYKRWNEVDEYDRIINYGNRESIFYSNESNIVSRNWKIFRIEKKIEYNHVISYDYEYEYETLWALFIPYKVKYKQPFRIVQDIYYTKEDKVDDLNYKKYGDWKIERYGSTRKDYYTSRYRV